MDPRPGNLTASRTAVLPGGDVALIVLDESTTAFGRWHSGGSWSPWRVVATHVRDVSVAAAAASGRQPEALVSVVCHISAPLGAVTVLHVPWQLQHYVLTADGIEPAAL